MIIKVDLLGRIYVAIMCGYFIVSGLNAIMDIDTKLDRIGLSAIDLDGKVAFILIYCSLMVGSGVGMALIAYLSQSWFYSGVLATTIICSFIFFRFVGSYIVGEVSQTQINYILIEAAEVGLGLVLLGLYRNKEKDPNK